jgi:hypothetical protein
MPFGTRSQFDWRYNNVVQSGVLWSPALLRGVNTARGQCMAWFDASDLSTLTLDGSGNVTTWADKSGLGNTVTQATSANRPGYTYGPRASVNFVAASSHALVDSSGAGITTAVQSGLGVTVGCVLTPTASLSTSRVIIAESRSSVSTPFFVVGSGGTTGSALGIDFRNDASTRTQLDLTNTGLVVSGTSLLAMFTIITAAERGYVNDDGTTNAGKSNALSGATTVDRFAIGTRATNGGNTNFIDANINEIVVLRGTTDFYRNQLAGYLAWKWGFNQLLPAGHLYKNVPTNNIAGYTRSRYPNIGKATAAPGGTVRTLMMTGAG